jgi:hypothetical protein
VVLGGGTEHGRAADIDVLDGVLEGAAGLGHGRLEGIEIDHHHVDRLDAMGLHHHMLGIGPQAQQAAMHLGVQGLHPPVQHLRKAGELGDVLDCQAGSRSSLAVPPVERISTP